MNAVSRWMLLGALISGGHAGAQNLLSNPNFKNTLKDWADPSNAWVHDANTGSPASGSAFGNNTLEHDMYCVSLHQCMPSTSGRVYRFGATCRVLPNQNSVGTCYAEMHWYPSENCNLASLQNAYAPAVQQAGSWAEFSGSGVSPDGAHSQGLVLSLCKYDAGGSLKANLDSAYVYDTVAPPGRGDFDMDGHVDLVLHNTVSGDNRIWTMNGAQRLTTQLVTPPASGALIRASGDFNGDSHSDLVLRENTTGDIDFWFMNGAARVGAPVALTGAATPALAWNLSAAGDFNHDGKPDLLWLNSSTQALVIWTMDGTVKAGEIVPNPDHAADANWSVAAAVDFDKDDNTDLLWYNATSGKIVLWRMDANAVRTAGEFTSPDSAGGSNWRVVAAGDYSTNQSWLHTEQDIVWRNATSGKFVIWHMDPNSVPLTRTSGDFTTPDAPTANPIDWTIVGPK